MLPPSLFPLTKDVATRSDFLLGNNSNVRIGPIQASQNMLQTHSNSPYYKNSKKFQRFPKIPGKHEVQQQ